MKTHMRTMITAGALLVGFAIGTHAQSLSYNSGQGVAPAYEGWEETVDGVKYFLFGYMNRNWEEEIDLAVGPQNAFSPGASDLGQPTHFLPRRKGVILNNSSVHEIIPKPKYLPYSISKGGMENLTKSLALEYAGDGIRVNSVGPGAVVTSINKAWIDNPKARGEVESHIPMSRPAAADEIASVFAFLASDDASYVTGQTIFACGGLTLYPEFRVAWSSGE